MNAAKEWMVLALAILAIIKMVLSIIKSSLEIKFIKPKMSQQTPTTSPTTNTANSARSKHRRTFSEWLDVSMCICSQLIVVWLGVSLFMIHSSDPRYYMSFLALAVILAIGTRTPGR